MLGMALTCSEGKKDDGGELLYIERDLLLFIPPLSLPLPLPTMPILFIPEIFAKARREKGEGGY